MKKYRNQLNIEMSINKYCFINNLEVIKTFLNGKYFK